VATLRPVPWPLDLKSTTSYCFYYDIPGMISIPFIFSKPILFAYLYNVYTCSRTCIRKKIDYTQTFPTLMMKLTKFRHKTNHRRHYNIGKFPITKSRKSPTHSSIWELVNLCCFWYHLKVVKGKKTCIIYSVRITSLLNNYCFIGIVFNLNFWNLIE
jgi:hypothetical protein